MNPRPFGGLPGRTNRGRPTGHPAIRLDESVLGPATPRVSAVAGRARQSGPACRFPCSSSMSPSSTPTLCSTSQRRSNAKNRCRCNNRLLQMQQPLGDLQEGSGRLSQPAAPNAAAISWPAARAGSAS
jgi:hypothetical protein